MSTHSDHPGWFHNVVTRTGRESVYLLATLPLAIASFVVIVTGLALGVGLAIIWVGLPIGVGTLAAARGFARIERLRLRACGTVIEEVKVPLPAGTLWARFTRTLRNPDLWREALHGVLALPISCITWSVTITWWAMVVAGLTGPVWEGITQHYGAVDSGSGPLMRLLGWPIPAGLFDFGVGLLALVTLPPIIRACAAIHVGLARALLSQDRASLERRVAELSQARDQLGRAESDGLRRLERDLHDGPQQSLIRLGMDLDAAQRRLKEGDVDAASAL
ncbi:MAG: sensor domain-containing protein, partial [Propionibacteriaceae bacterium]|nr:sensor domain-containing protein [Propionibacteriaceae bacterium]